MKKKSFFIWFIGILSLFFLVGCGNYKEDKITFKEKNITIPIGSSTKLELIENVKNVRYKSSNEDIVFVNENGYIIGKNNGTATITAYLSENEKINDRCNVTVYTEPTIIYPTNISLNTTNINLKIGDTYKLSYSIEPSNATTNIKWETSNSEVATVDNNGLVTAKKDGTATITVKTSNKLYDTCSIKIDSLENIAVTDISLNKTNVNIKTKRLVSLVATITPSNATNKSVTWESSNPSVAKVDNNGKVTGLEIGEATIIAKTNNGKTATARIKVDPLSILIIGNSKTFRTNSIDKSPSFNFVELAYKNGYLTDSSKKIETKKKDSSNFIGVHKNVTITAKNGSNFATRVVSPFSKYILARNFDVIILQEKTSIAALPDFNKYYDDTKRIIELIGGKNYKGQIYFRTSWPPKTSDFSKDLKYMNSNTEKVASMINKEYGIKTYVINDGNAFKEALNNKIEVYVSDNNHQNINGAYLSALCMYVKVYNEDGAKVKTDLYVTNKDIANKLKIIANSECK